MPSNKQVAEQIQRIIADNGPLAVEAIVGHLKDSWPTISPEHNRYPKMRDKLYIAAVYDILIMGEDYGLFERFEEETSNVQEQRWNIGIARFSWVVPE